MPPTISPLRAPLAVFIAGVTAAMHIGKIPPAMGVLRDALGVSLVQAGFLFSTVQLAGMVLGVLVGAVSGAAGGRRSMLFGLALLALASLAGSAARQPLDLLILRAVEGFGFLCVVLPAPGLMRQLVVPHRLPVFLGLWGAYMPAGVAAALLLGPWLMAWWGWQLWWALLGGSAVAAALWLALSVAPDAERPHPVSPGGAPLRTLAHHLRATLGSAGPWAVAVSFAMYSCQWLAVIGFLPTIYAQAGVGVAAAGALTALACLANVVGNLGGGALMRSGWPASRMLTVGFVGMVSCAVLAFSPILGDAALLRFVAVVAFSAVGGIIPATLFALAVKVAPTEGTVSTTMGWVQQCSACGQFLGPPVVAWVAAWAGGWQWTWVVAALTSAVGLVLAQWLRWHVASQESAGAT